MAYVTGRPLLAEALSKWSISPTSMKKFKLEVSIVCDNPVITVLEEIGVAAAKVVSPPWDAARVQVPAVSSVSVNPETVHTAELKELMVGVKPLDEVVNRE